MYDSEITTRGVTVAVRVRYLPERSEPGAGRYFFAYRIRISNHAEETVQLLTRHWIITDGNGNVEEVRGPGVVGEQPRLAPGEGFRYTSFCPLGTSLGAMHGTYTMRLDTGDLFEATIAPFALVDPATEN